MLTTLLTNAIGPALVAKHFSPLMECKAPEYSKFIHLSARLGSIEDN